MLMPSIFGEDLFDDWMDFPFDSRIWGGKHPQMRKHPEDMMMKTDVKEHDGGYELVIDMPGIKKEDVHAELKDGYLTVQASRNSSNDEKDENGRYIRRERLSGSFSRSFYVGDAVTQEDIKAKFEDGTLKLSIPKKEVRPAAEEKKYIAIEG
ncbi:MAG: Hsp20/alpha crystallin family protein [Eubacteriales bacterium]|nr:Hsp20/alpha crystallin family protein [Eubacteriales bacterium]